MNKRILSLVLALFFSLLLLGQGFKGVPKGNENVKAQNLKFEKEVLLLVNKIRVQHHLQVFRWNEDLARAARYHARDMAEDNYLEHATYDRKKNNLVKVCGTFERIEKFVQMTYLGENISAGKTNPKETVEAWMKSKHHRENILNPNYKYLGVAYYYKANTTYLHYWVQDFGGK
jgi:uncharacterized protein YkwD